MNVARCAVCGGIITKHGNYWIHSRIADAQNAPHEATPRKDDQ